MSQENSEYFRSRAEEHRTRSAPAIDRDAARVHRDLAERYEKKAAGEDPELSVMTAVTAEWLRERAHARPRRWTTEDVIVA